MFADRKAVAQVRWPCWTMKWREGKKRVNGKDVTCNCSGRRVAEEQWNLLEIVDGCSPPPHKFPPPPPPLMNVPLHFLPTEGTSGLRNHPLSPALWIGYFLCVGWLVFHPLKMTATSCWVFLRCSPDSVVSLWFEYPASSQRLRCFSFFVAFFSKLSRVNCQYLLGLWGWFLEFLKAPIF